MHKLVFIIFEFLQYYFLLAGIITDLARVTHNLDLSSPNVSATINAVLKPLETLTRSVNQPSSVNCQRHQKNKANNGNAGEAENSEAANANPETNPASIANNGAGTNTTNSEATRAQGDETVEPDAEATEHDVSTAAESIDPNSESQLHVSYLFKRKKIILDNSGNYVFKNILLILRPLKKVMMKNSRK